MGQIQYKDIVEPVKDVHNGNTFTCKDGLYFESGIFIATNINKHHS